MIARVLREAAWAPIAVLLLAWMVGRLPIAGDFWWFFHLLGGAALAYFCVRAIAAASPARYVAAFIFAVIGAIGWELAEFAWDQAFGTTLQKGHADTMSDLYLSACGAAAYLSWAALPGRERKAGDQAAR